MGRINGTLLLSGVPPVGDDMYCKSGFADLLATSGMSMSLVLLVGCQADVVAAASAPNDLTDETSDPAKQKIKTFKLLSAMALLK